MQPTDPPPPTHPNPHVRCEQLLSTLPELLAHPRQLSVELPNERRPTRHLHLFIDLVLQPVQTSAAPLKPLLGEFPGWTQRHRTTRTPAPDGFARTTPTSSRGGGSPGPGGAATPAAPEDGPGSTPGRDTAPPSPSDRVGGPGGQRVSDLLASTEELVGLPEERERTDRARPSPSRGSPRSTRESAEPPGSRRTPPAVGGRVGAGGLSRRCGPPPA